MEEYAASDKHDVRLRTYAGDFIHPHASPLSRPSSRASNCSAHSETSNTNSTRASGKPSVPKKDKEQLRGALILWREKRHERKGSSKYLSPSIAFPDNLIKVLVDNCIKFITAREVTEDLILSMIKWASATPEDLKQVVQEIEDWRSNVVVIPELQSQRADKAKRARTAVTVPAERCVLSDRKWLKP